jgi:cytoskeletal protein RodZ
MVKVRAADVLFWLLAALTLVFLVGFLLVLSGGIAIESAAQATEPTEATAAETETTAAETETTAAETETTAKTETTETSPETETTATETEPVETTAAPATPGTTTPTPATARLATVVLTATRGDCWFQARDGSARGEVLDERVLSQGESISLKGKSVWLAVGAAGNLDVTVNGKPRALSPGTISVVLGPADPATS